MHEEVRRSLVLCEVRRLGLRRKTYTDAFFTLCYMFAVMEKVCVWKPKKMP